MVKKGRLTLRITRIYTKRLRIKRNYTKRQEIVKKQKEWQKGKQTFFDVYVLQLLHFETLTFRNYYVQ